LWTRDEALGFEGIFFSEHHFGGSYGASPNLLIAAMAQRTRTMRLGVMGVVLPYYHPARVVEEIGMLDHLTGGRLEIGTAIGIPQELARLGLSMEEARERNDEIVAILHASLKQRAVTHRGKYFSFSDLRMQPPTMQEPPPVWTTVVSIESARKAARRGSKISTGFNATRADQGDLRRLSRGGGPRRHSRRARSPGAAPPRHRGVDHGAGARQCGGRCRRGIKEYVAQDPRAKLKPVPDAPDRRRLYAERRRVHHRHAGGGRRTDRRAMPRGRRRALSRRAELERAVRRGRARPRAVRPRGGAGAAGSGAVEPSRLRHLHRRLLRHRHHVVGVEMIAEVDVSGEPCAEAILPVRTPLQSERFH
jgi:hypothetical protein